mmetsp:Transcript_26522/g.44269  ORF Transcript_26522/g.44269 Transcript_26522/m.44269 type:complete len:210 (+) Transcript_26522:807-1436(+)
MTDNSGAGTSIQNKSRNTVARDVPGKKRLEKSRCVATGVVSPPPPPCSGVDGVVGRKSAATASAPGQVGAVEASAQRGCCCCCCGNDDGACGPYCECECEWADDDCADDCADVATATVSLSSCGGTTTTSGNRPLSFRKENRDSVAWGGRTLNNLRRSRIILRGPPGITNNALYHKSILLSALSSVSSVLCLMPRQVVTYVSLSSSSVT